MDWHRMKDIHACANRSQSISFKLKPPPLDLYIYFFHFLYFWTIRSSEGTPPKPHHFLCDRQVFILLLLLLAIFIIPLEKVTVSSFGLNQLTWGIHTIASLSKACAFKWYSLMLWFNLQGKCCWEVKVSGSWVPIHCPWHLRFPCLAEAGRCIFRAFLTSFARGPHCLCHMHSSLPQGGPVVWT